MTDVETIQILCDIISESVYNSLEKSKIDLNCVGRPDKGDLPRIALRTVNYGAFSRKFSNVDIVHVLDDRALPIIAPFVNKLVITIHDVMIEEFLIQVKNIGSSGLRNLPRFMDHYGPQLPLEYLSVVKANRIIINSPIVAERLTKSYGGLVAGKIRIVPPGFDPNRFNPTFINRKEAKQKLGLDTSAKMILVVGGDRTSSRRKGFPCVLSALDCLYRSGKLKDINFFLLLIGGFPEKWLSQYPHLRSYIIHKPYISDDLMPVFYRAADLFVMPSTSEGWGIALIEALACGAPVISSRNVPSAFAAKPTGVVCIEDVTDSKQFGEAMLVMLTNKEISQIDWNMVFDFLVEHFSWSNLCKSLLTVYNELSE
jgi:glycosyltransferase involved in cell wall biosynthesis